MRNNITTILHNSIGPENAFGGGFVFIMFGIVFGLIFGCFGGFG